MKQQTLETIFEDQLKDLHSAETQLTKALPKMARKASTDALRKAIEDHLVETQEQLARLNTIGDQLNLKLTGKKCKAMEGLIEEGKEALEEESSTLTDILIVAAAQRVEHYEISAYGTAAAIADQLGLSGPAKLLRSTLEEESAADEGLTAICEESLFPEARSAAEDETEERTSFGKSKGRSSSVENRR